jgi:DinB superfamily
VVHHVPDSHLNAYCRLKLALTEDQPTIRTYHEERWAELVDYKAPIENSLALLDCVHQRWLLVLRAIAEPDWTRRLVHPDLGVITVETLVADYAWHGRHHVAQITSLRDRPAKAQGA